jgi:cytochrome aa3-600 menaquinol oxidase subunit 2
VSLLATGCGPQYVVLHPAGPVAASELHLMGLAAAAMGLVILAVFVLFFVVVIRFRERPNNQAPYLPHWDGHPWLERLWFLVPAVLLTVIAIPMVRLTYSLTHVPQSQDRAPLVIDVTSLQWKWLFEYPGQHVATVNYVVIPANRPILFELTADSPMNTFWVPQLGGMEYTMPGRVLPLWLEADKPGVYWGHSGQFSGLEFEKMFFDVRAVSPQQFAAWVAEAHKAPPMTLLAYHRLLQFNTVGQETYGAYPHSTFPSVTHGFTLNGGMYMLMSNDPRRN